MKLWFALRYYNKMDAPPAPLRRIPLPPPQRNYIHKLSDNSILRKMAALDIVKIDIWHGNRILNEEHKKDISENLKGGIQSLDLKPYHLVSYLVEDGLKTYIVDGQHRVSILKDAARKNMEQLNFDVIVIEKRCDSETEVIEYFKLLNTTKAIQWKEDPILQANAFIEAFEKEFSKGKVKLIRPEGCHRPYMCTKKLRDAIVKCNLCSLGKTPEQFVEHALLKNKQFIEHFKSMTLREKLYDKALVIGFCLAIDEKFLWFQGFV